jgi:nitrite reductase/ring-hydroxylating ferredoxin subunit
MDRLQPPSTKGHLSVARPARWWYVACRSADLGRRPIARTVLGTPLVLFRAAGGRPAALLDRCPHRNVPLSLGRVHDSGRLECAYHGWQLDGTGRCRLVPGLGGEAEAAGRRALSYATVERDGFVWIFATPDTEPTGEPLALPLKHAAGYATIERVLDVEATVHATVENALDVPHTAFLHRGLFRGSGTPNEIRAVVRRWGDRVEAEYLGEPRPEGLIGRLLSPGGGTVEHWDRFLLPSVAQVEYRLGPENHLVVTSICTPVADFLTRQYAVVSFRLRVPAMFVRWLLAPLAMRILRQDAALLRRQTANVRRFGGEQYESTDLDLLGPHVWRLLREAEEGVAVPGEGSTLEREVRFRA